MKVRQIIETGEVQSISLGFYGNEVTFTVEGGEVTVSLTEDTMKDFHKRLGNKLTKMAEERLADAKQLVETEDE
tara:strand:- start:285 stop:506 length:222 start_codon:yes stop_codon:yes gene_type:complete